MSGGPRVLVAPDSFKGTFSAAEVAAAMARGVEGAGLGADLCPLADGGEGTAAALLAGAGETLRASATDPLGRPLDAEFALLANAPAPSTPRAATPAPARLPFAAYMTAKGNLNDSGSVGAGSGSVGAGGGGLAGAGGGGGGGGAGAGVDRGAGRVAVVEVAAASGLPLVAAAERDAEAASSRGTGELIAAAIEAGASRVLVAAGGSATSDGGAGAIAALRERGGLGGAELAVLCDTRVGFLEAATVFAPQKGADPAAVARLERRLDAFARTLPRDPRGVSMAGAAGGLAGGLWAAFGAELFAGARFVFEALGVAARARAADLVLSGEGRLDSQSLDGKLVGSLARLCAEAGTPLAVIAGSVALSPTELAAAGIASAAEAPTLAAIEAAAASSVRRLSTAG